MQSRHNERLRKLESAVNPQQGTCDVPQIVIYNPVTGEPITPLDAKAIKQIWFADDGQGNAGLER